MIRRAALILALALLPCSALAGSTPMNHYHVWGEITLDALNWKTDRNQLLLVEGLLAGNNGFIYDPYLVNYSASAGVNWLHLNRDGDWGHSMGWTGSAILRALPASRFPLLLHFNHVTLGLSPGGNPAYNRSNLTEVGGQWLLRLVDWPELRVEAWHTMVELNLGAGSTVLDLGQDTLPYSSVTSRATVELKRGVGKHKYHMEFNARDHSDEWINFRERHIRFLGTDRSDVAWGVVLEGMVEGEVGEVGDVNLTTTTPFSDYRSRIGLLYVDLKRVQITAYNEFRQAEFAGSTLTNDELIGEVYVYLKEWLELFGGLGVTYWDQQLGATRSRAAREQLGAGVRVQLPLLGGSLRGQALLRVGESQVIDEGHGVLVAATAALTWDRLLSRYLTLELHGQSYTERDWSPIGSDGDVYLGRAGFTLRGLSRFSLRSYAYASHQRQHEELRGTYTDTYTDLGLQLDSSIALTQRIQGGISCGYSHYIASQIGTENSVFGEARLVAAPLHQLNLSASGFVSSRFRGDDDIFTLVRADARVSWRVRQLTLLVHYQFMMDDYRDIRGGDHLVMARVVRRFDFRFGWDQ